MTESVMPTYGRLDITFAKGEGAWLTDTRGERYLSRLPHWYIPRIFIILKNNSYWLTN